MLADRNNAGTLQSHYDRTALGLDRLANLVAARMIAKNRNLIILSSGTALTVDVMEGRRHVGGFILPGLGLLRESLYNRTDLLPLVIDKQEKLGLGLTTEDAIRHGTTLLFEEGLSGVLRFIRRNRPKRYVVMTTGYGGFPKRFSDCHHSMLTFLGIYLLCRTKFHQKKRPC